MDDVTRRSVIASAGAAAVAASSLSASATDPTPPHADAAALRAAHRRSDFSRTIGILKREIPIKMSEHDVPGLAIGLVQGNDLVWAEGFGFTDRSKRRPVTADTLFSLQSMSKGYTAVGVLRAVERGWLNLDDHLVQHMPGFTVKSRFGPQEHRKITIRQLLSHFAGLCHEAPLGNNCDDRPCTFAEHVASISDTWLKHPVGTQYAYSNLGVDLAGFVLEQRSGGSFERYMKEEVLDPIGMRRSTFDQARAITLGDVARGNMGDFAVPHLSIPMRAAGGLYSNVRDMARFVSFQLARGEAGARRVLAPELIDEMQRPQFPVPGQVGGYGLGLINLATRGAYAILHSGGGYGFNSDHRWFPDYGLGVVVACNQETGNPASIVSDLAVRLMITELLGAIPVTLAQSAIRQPYRQLDPADLRRFAGTYQRRSSLATVGEQYGWLVIDGNSAAADVDGTFTYENQRYQFLTDPAGAVQRVHIVSPNFPENGSEYWWLNDTPHDPAGPNRAEWKSFAGKYAGRETAKPIAAEVLVKNGYLYLDGAPDTNWHGGLKLSEYRPGLFFTADGESIEFSAGRMALGNRPFVKQG